MTAFDLGAAGIGAAGGIAGAIIGGRSANRAARDARGFSRANARRAEAYLRAALFGTVSPGQLDSGDPYGAYPESIRARLGEIDRMLADPGLDYKQIKGLAKERDNLAGRAGSFLPPPSLGEAGIRKLYGEDATGRLGEFDDTMSRLMGFGGDERKRLLETLGTMRPLADRMVGEAEGFGSAARTAAQTAHDRSVVEGAADLNRRFAGRGLAGSSGQANLEATIRARAAGGLSQAFAGIERDKSDLMMRALSERMGTERDVLSQIMGFDAGELSTRRALLAQRLGLQGTMRDRTLGSYERGNALSASGFNPNALYMNPALASPNYTTQNFANMFAGLGGNMFGYGLRGLFGRRDGSPEPSIEDMRRDARVYGGVG